MRVKILICFLLFCATETSLYAQDHYNFSRFTHETKSFIWAPTHWRGKDWLTVGAIAAGTIVSMQFDEPVRNKLIRSGRPLFHSVPIEIGRVWGEPYTLPIVVTGFGLHGWLAHKQSSSKIAFEVAQAVIYSEAITQFGKIAFGRARPYLNEGSKSYHPFDFRGMGFQSFPGGHATEGWAMSTVLSRNVHSRLLKVLVFVPATLTAVSRVYQDKHWTSDCVLGAAIGFAVGNWVVSHHDNKPSSVGVSSLVPFTLSYRF